MIRIAMQIPYQYDDDQILYSGPRGNGTRSWLQGSSLSLDPTRRTASIPRQRRSTPSLLFASTTTIQGTMQGSGTPSRNSLNNLSSNLNLTKNNSATNISLGNRSTSLVVDLQENVPGYSLAKHPATTPKLSTHQIVASIGTSKSVGSRIVAAPPKFGTRQNNRSTTSLPNSASKKTNIPQSARGARQSPHLLAGAFKPGTRGAVSTFSSGSHQAKPKSVTQPKSAGKHQGPSAAKAKAKAAAQGKAQAKSGSKRFNSSKFQMQPVLNFDNIMLDCFFIQCSLSMLTFRLHSVKQQCHRPTSV